MIAVIDYEMGNVRSVYNSLRYIGQDVVVTSDPEVIDKASHIILPGVGAFGDAMNNLNKKGLTELLEKQVVGKGKPFLGICLGLQLLAKSSQEHGYHGGLGWLDANVIKFHIDNPKIKIPHMGWNDINLEFNHPLFDNLKNNQLTFYFVHSYHIVCKKKENILATCDYGFTFTAAVVQDNIIATQFHPEKSHDNGIQVLNNFVAWNP